MDVDPTAFRKILDYLYTFKLAANCKHIPDLPSDMDDLIEFFKLGDGAKKDTKVATSSIQKDKDEHAMLDEMMKNLDVLEKKLEDEESFVSYFTESADEDANSNETKQSSISDDVKSFSSDTDQESFANIERGPVYNGIATLFINGDILRYRTSTLCAEKDCKIAKDILNTDWIDEHTIVTEQGRKCILMEYPREALKELLAYFQSKMMLGKVSGKGFDLFGAEYSMSMIASIFPPENAILKGWAFDETTLMTLRQKKTLRQWLKDAGRSMEPSLLYRASRDGRYASAFHGRCDNKGNTVVVAKSSDGSKVFGGYTDIAWSNARGRQYNYTSHDSFLFVLSPNPIKMMIKSGQESEAIYNGSSSYGPVFGSGNDFSIQGNASTSNLGNTYDCPSTLSTSFLQCDLADYEVYQV
jgi:hypothetical protein